MTKDDRNTILIIVGFVTLIGTLIYLGNGNRNVAGVQPASKSSNAAAVGGDPMHSGLASAVSLGPIDALVNKQVPSFSFSDRDGNVYSSDNLRGKKVMLFFSEGLMCYPACWNQMLAFAKDDRFKTKDTIVLTVLTDSPQDWQQAINKVPDLANALVVFDAGGAASRKFGTLTAPSSMHPGSLPGHTYILIDTQGVVRYVYDDPNMAVRNDELIAEMNKLN